MSATVAAGQDRPPMLVLGIPARKFIAFIFMVFGMFMAILDIQIVSASLSEIQAGLAASSDEISWVQTSYLIAEVIMIPLSGFLSRALSTRWLFAASAAGFTIMSFMCATATSINEMIVYRALQGFIGGGMIPTVFATAFSAFPRNKQAVVSPIIGLVMRRAGKVVGTTSQGSRGGIWLVRSSATSRLVALNRMVGPSRPLSKTRIRTAIPVPCLA